MQITFCLSLRKQPASLCRVLPVLLQNLSLEKDIFVHLEVIITKLNISVIDYSFFG